jgi:GntR family transcriptional repressor for pyruvate dehydrogenase complex
MSFSSDDVLKKARDYIEVARESNSSRLPPESRLAEELGVTRGRLRAVLKRLEAEGLIWRHVGKGTFIGQRTLTGQLSSLAELINPLDAFEARIIIEPQLAALAALRAAPHEIEEMRECAQRMQALTSFAEWSVQDQRLHRLVAKAARNTLLLALYDAARESTPTGMRARAQRVFASGPRPGANAEHQLYVDAIADRDPERAEALMRAHLQAVRKALFGDR